MALVLGYARRPPPPAPAPARRPLVIEAGGLYSLREAARALRLDRSGALSRAIEAGLIRVVKVAAVTRISGKEILRIQAEGLPSLPGGRRAPRNVKDRAPRKRTRPVPGSISKIPL